MALSAKAVANSVVATHLALAADAYNVSMASGTGPQTVRAKLEYEFARAAHAGRKLRARELHWVLLVLETGDVNKAGCLGGLCTLPRDTKAMAPDVKRLLKSHSKLYFCRERVLELACM